MTDKRLLEVDYATAPTTEQGLIFDATTGLFIPADLAILATALTPGRVPFADGSGRLTDDADLTFSGATLSATNVTSSGTVTGGTVTTDTISEKTAAAGVTIDGVNIKDSLIEGQDPTLKTVAFQVATAAGTDQTGATGINTGYTRVSGAAVGSAEGVRLPAAAFKNHCVVVNYNNSGANLKIYPANGDAISGAGGVNLPITIAPLRIADLYALDGLYWVYVT